MKTLLIMLLAFTLTQPHEFRVKLNGVTDPESAKTASVVMQLMLDAKPSFNDTTDVFTIRTQYAITPEKFAEKMLANGYVVTSFTEKTDDQNEK